MKININFRRIKAKLRFDFTRVVCLGMFFLIFVIYFSLFFLGRKYDDQNMKVKQEPQNKIEIIGNQSNSLYSCGNNSVNIFTYFYVFNFVIIFCILHGFTYVWLFLNCNKDCFVFALPTFHSLDILLVFRKILACNIYRVIKVFILFLGLCNLSFTDAKDVYIHLNDHWSNNDLACKLCDFVGIDLAAIVSHR